MSDRHDTAFRQISDNDSFLSIVSSSAGGDSFPPVCVFAHLVNAPEVKTFKGKMDTGAVLCLIAEHVVRNRWGIEHIDQEKSMILDDLGLNGVKTLGQIRLIIRLGPCEKRMNVAFEVIPDAYVKNRYDALLSDKVLERSGIMAYHPKGKNKA